MGLFDRLFGKKSNKDNGYNQDYYVPEEIVDEGTDNRVQYQGQEQYNNQNPDFAEFDNGQNNAQYIDQNAQYIDQNAQYMGQNQENAQYAAQNQVYDVNDPDEQRRNSWNPTEMAGNSARASSVQNTGAKGYTINPEQKREASPSTGPGYRLNVNTAQAAQSAQTVPAVLSMTDEVRAEYRKSFRAEFRHHFPKNLNTVESHMQLPYMVGSALDVSAVIDYAGNNVYSKFEAEPDKLAELGRAAVAKVAMSLESFLASSDMNGIAAVLTRAHNESLEKAWIVLDFYCGMLNSEYTRSIAALYDLITDEIVRRTAAPAGVAKSESYEEVLAKCAKLASESPDAAELPALKKRLFEKLCALENIYVVQDEAFNSNFPYIGADGRLEIQTNSDRADAMKVFLEKNGDSKVSIVKYGKEEYEKLFSGLLHHGLTIIRVDNGLTPVEIDIEELFDNGERNLVERCNRYARRMFISELQYGYRLRMLIDAGKKDSDDYRILSASMIKARSEGYRALAGGLVYVFNIGGAKPGTTLYTPKAMHTASEIMKVMGIVDESVLVSPADSAYEVFNGEIALRSVQRKVTDPEKRYVCAFTDRQNAEKIYSRFANAGASDAVVVMTLGELCGNCHGTAGFVLDMSSYGLEVPVEIFGKMSECIKSEGIIVGGKGL